MDTTPQENQPKNQPLPKKDTVDTTIKETIDQHNKACCYQHCTDHQPEPKYKWGLTKYEFWSFASGALGVVLTAIAIYLVIRQNGISQEALDEARRANDLTNQTIADAKEESKAHEARLERQDKINEDRFREQGELAQSQIKTLTKQAEFAEKQYQAEIQPTIVGSITKVGMVKNQGTVPVEIEITNTSSYPVRIRWGTIRIVVFTDTGIPKVSEEVENKPIQIYERTIGTVRPTTTFKYLVDLELNQLKAMGVTEEQYWEDVESGRGFVYLLGRFTFQSMVDNSEWQYQLCHQLGTPLAFRGEYQPFEDNVVRKPN